MNPVYSQIGQLIGWLSGNVLFGADGKNVAFVRSGKVYSYERGERRGELIYRMGRAIWLNKNSEIP